MSKAYARGWTISKTGVGKIADQFNMTGDAYNARAVTGGAIERMLEPEEVAELAVFFASDLSGATTGHRNRFGYRCAVSVCGGFKMH